MVKLLDGKMRIAYVAGLYSTFEAMDYPPQRGSFSSSHLSGHNGQTFGHFNTVVESGQDLVILRSNYNKLGVWRKAEWVFSQTEKRLIHEVTYPIFISYQLIRSNSDRDQRT